jgi:ABC-2 type transport system ATP-binding protein
LKASEPVIVIERLSKWYGRIIAVNDVSISISRGVTGLLGPNGAGKSSLIRCISGHLLPSLGVVTVQGERPWRNPAVAKNIGLCTDLGWLMDELTPTEFISFDLRIRGASETESRERAADSLAQFDLEHVAERRISTLSRGTRQRVKLAQAFAFDPDVLVLDEPLTGIDPVARATTVKRIKERGAAGRCILVSSHVLHEVESMTEEVLLLHKGRLIANGNVMEIRDLIEQHPHRIAIECDRPRDLARLLVDIPSIQGFTFPRDGVVELHTQRPDECYSAIAPRALGADIRIRAITSPDATLEMLFKYLVGESP